MISAIIVAAGKGTRMGPNVDKLFLELHGCPIVAHTWRRFEEVGCIDEIVMVIREGTEAAIRELGERYRFRKKLKLVAGGPERQDSVWNGLEGLSPGTEIVAIQDAARPCTSQALIAATVAAARETGAAVAAQGVTDTVKESRDGKLIERTLDRARLWAVQTPQTFRVEILRRALAEVRRRGLRVTDDTAACELIGQPVQLVLSAEPNPKVTRPEDLPFVEALLRSLVSPLVLKPEVAYLSSGFNYMNKSLVVVPTYNERENLPALAQRLHALPVPVDVLIVDDNSPDGTGKLADDLASANPAVHVLHRKEKSGLGRAYLAGFKWALENGYDFVFELDGDFSHNPDDIPMFLEAARNADLVLGSRYLNGIRIINWPLSRLMLSKSAAKYVQVITGMPITDPTGGYKCFSRRALEAINLDQINSNGYSFQIEMTHRLWRQGMRIVEVPIVFT